MTEDLQKTYRVHWLSNNQHCTDFLEPIVGGWVLESAILHDDPAGEQFLIDRMYAGNLDGLTTVLQSSKCTSKLKSLFGVFLEANPERLQQVQHWVLTKPLLLQNRDLEWQRWMRSVLFVSIDR
jgi:hypothetical protein